MGASLIRSLIAISRIIINCLLLAVVCQAIDQSYLDNMAFSLNLRFEVLSNFAGGCFIGLTFNNKGHRVIKPGKWAIYFSSMRKLNQNTNRFTVDPRDKLTITHINGHLHKLEPTKYFSNFLPGEDFKFYLNTENAIVSKTDVMPNWYIAANTLEPRIILSTKGESLKFVGPFDTPSKWKRSPQDTYNPFTPEKRFQINNIADIKRAGNLITPTPLVLKVLSSSKTVSLFSGTWDVVARQGLENEGRYLAEKLNIQLIQRKRKPREFIELKIGTVKIENKSVENDEAYNLKVDPQEKVIRITGNTPKGVFWGIQSLLSIMKNGEVPWVAVEDCPRYEYRGLSIDVARNFLPKVEVMRILDGMAMYKMNKLHLHLTDDEGWRLEIPGLPELTEIASQRCHDLQEKRCLEPQLGSGPFNNSSGSGYYSVKDYQEILKYAKERHTDIIPEIDLPGHSHAAITAMENRYRKYRDMGKTEDGLRFSLRDLQDKSFYQSVQFFFNNSVNPCVETSYDFVANLVFQVRAMHEKIQPLKAIHLGGDEVPLGAWSLSPACQKLLMKINSYQPDLDAFFIKRVAKIAGKYGVNLAMWEDGFMSNTQTPINRRELDNDVVYSYAWGKNMNPSIGYKLANAGYKVVMTQASHLYFDHPYEPDPEERGIYWATRYTDTRKVFGFMPEQLYDSLETDGNGMSTADYCVTVRDCVTPRKLDNIVGMAGTIWSETVRTPNQFQSMIFPRLLAVAERAWHRDAWENEGDKFRRNTMKEASWGMFANTLGYKELARLDKLGINYHIPLPGARIVAGVLKTNVAFPGLTVECSIDGGQTWFDPKMESVVSGKLLLRTRSADGKRTSRIAQTKLSRNYYRRTFRNNFYF